MTLGDLEGHTHFTCKPFQVWFLLHCCASTVLTVVCLSDYLFVTCRYCVKTPKLLITQTVPHDSPDLGEILTGSSPMGATTAGGVV